MQIVVGGCLAQKDRDLDPASGRRHVDVVFGTHNVHRAVELLARGPRATGPITEIWTRPLDEADAVPLAPCRSSARSPYAAWVTIQIGCDNTLRLLHRARRCGAARSAGPSTTSSAEVERLAADGVTEVTLLGQNVNSYGRDLTLRRPAKAATDVPGPARCSPTCSRAVGGGRGHPPGALHEPAPEGPAARDHRRHGRRPTRCASTCTCRCSRAATGVLAAMHRGYTAERYLERLAAARAAHRRPRRHHRHHRRLPRRDRRRLRAHPRGGRRGRVRQRLHLHLLAPARHRGGRAGRPLRRPGRRRRALRAAPGRGRALRRCAKHEARVGRVEEVDGRGPEQARTPRVLTGRTRQNKLVHFPSPAPAPRRHLRHRRGHRRRRRTTCGASCVEVVAVATPPHPHPGRRRLSVARRHVALRRPDGVGQVGASPTAVARGRPDVRARHRRLHAGVPGHGHRHGQAHAGRAGRGAAPPPRPGRSRARSTPSPGSRPTRRAALADIEAPGPAGPARRRHRPLPAGRGRRPRRCPGQFPDGAGRARGRARHRRALHARLADARPGGRRPHGADATAAGSCGPSR